MTSQPNIQYHTKCPICFTSEIAEETDNNDHIGEMLCRNGHYFNPIINPSNHHYSFGIFILVFIMMILLNFSNI